MNLNEVLGPECWNMQADGSALSPLSGVKVCVTHGGERALLELRSGWRAFGSASGVFGRPDWASGDWSLSAEDTAGRWVNVRRVLRDREAA